MVSSMHFPVLVQCFAMLSMQPQNDQCVTGIILTHICWVTPVPNPRWALSAAGLWASVMGVLGVLGVTTYHLFPPLYPLTDGWWVPRFALGCRL